MDSIKVSASASRSENHRTAIDVASQTCFQPKDLKERLKQASKPCVFNDRMCSVIEKTD